MLLHTNGASESRHSPKAPFYAVPHDRVGGLEVGFVSACSWLALVAGVGGYVLAGVEIGVFLIYFSIFAGVRVVGGCVLVYALTHTQTTWVLDVRPGVGRTIEEPEEPRSTTVHYTCRPLSLWFA